MISRSTRWRYGLGSCHPDPFLFGQLNWDAKRVCIVMRQHRSSLKNQAKTVEEHRVTLEQQGLSRFSQAVRHSAAEL